MRSANRTFLKKLQDGGAPGFHFYTLNQSEPTLSICQQLLKNHLRLNVLYLLFGTTYNHQLAL